MYNTLSLNTKLVLIRPCFVSLVSVHRAQLALVFVAFLPIIFDSSEPVSFSRNALMAFPAKASNRLQNAESLVTGVKHGFRDGLVPYPQRGLSDYLHNATPHRLPAILKSLLCGT